jgi:hypothetical protein
MPASVLERRTAEHGQGKGQDVDSRGGHHAHFDDFVVEAFADDFEYFDDVRVVDEWHMAEIEDWGGGQYRNDMSKPAEANLEEAGVPSGVLSKTAEVSSFTFPPFLTESLQ